MDIQKLAIALVLMLTVACGPVSVGAQQTPTPVSRGTFNDAATGTGIPADSATPATNQATPDTSDNEPGSDSSSTPSPTITPSGLNSDTNAAGTPQPNATSTPRSGTGTSQLPSVDPQIGTPIEASGLLATVPEYAQLDLAELSALTDAVGVDSVPESLQLMALITRDDRSFLVLAVDWKLDRFVSAGKVSGFAMPMPANMPPELNFVGGLIVAPSGEIETPQQVRPAEVIGNPSHYALQRISMDTTYLFGGARIKDAPEGLDKLGFGQATDALGSSDQDDYLTVVDPYNTESQIRVAQVTGTVLYPTEGVRRLLDELYRFSPDDLREALDRPAIFYETLVDDEAPVVSINSLVPTPSDPVNKLGDFHGEVVSVEGIALGTMIRTEDVPVLEDMPVHVTVKGFVIADASGAMPVFAVSSLDESGEIFGHFRVELSVYRFDDGNAFAFLVGIEPVPLDPVKAITDAGFGDPVSLILGTYTSFHLDSVTLSEDLTIADADLLIPDNTSDPVILTRLDAIATGSRLSNVEVDGHFIGQPNFLASALTMAGQTGVPASGVVVADGVNVRYELDPLLETPVGPTVVVPSIPGL